jgi:hypothetical protein
MSHIKLKDLLNEVDWRINTKSISGGGGKRFIPTEGKVPSRVFTSLPDHFKLRGSRVFVSPEAIIAMNSIQRGRGGATNYKELTGKIQQAFSIPRTGANLNIGPADTSSDLSSFKKGLTGRLDSAVIGGKEFNIWSGEGKAKEDGSFVFPLDQFKNNPLEENEENLRSRLHTLVGNEMRLGKRADMTGASHHEEEHKKAEKELNNFLKNNPSMMNDFDTVTDHFMKQLFKENKEKFNSVRLIYKNDIDKFIKSNPALGSIYDEDTKKFKLYLYADLVGYYDPKYGRIDYEKDSRFAKISDEYKWDRNIN